MKEYTVEEDQGRLALYTSVSLLLTLLLTFFSSYLYSIGNFLLAFVGITGIWFSVKALWRYGKKLLKKTPVCEFQKKQLVIHSLPGKPIEMSYGKISQVKLLKDHKSIKLFFSGSEVKHPSGWNYVGIIYLFKRGSLDKVEKNVKDVLAKHGLKIELAQVEKSKLRRAKQEKVKS